MEKKTTEFERPMKHVQKKIEVIHNLKNAVQKIMMGNNQKSKNLKE